MPVADSSPAEVVHVQQAHGVAEMLIPVDREVHPPLQGLIGFVVEKPVQGGEGSVELRHQSGAVEHHGSATGAEIVHDMERPSARVQDPGEPQAVPLGNPSLEPDQPEQPQHDHVPKQHMEQQLLVVPPGAEGGTSQGR
jgi:hypothetical protein